MKETILIPEERVNVLKESKDRIEKELKVKMAFEGNLIEIDGEGLELYTSKLIVKAIGRGFSPNNALRLLSDEEQLEIIELKKYSENKMRTIKARLIGDGGKTRKFVEKYSRCSMSVYGKTVSLIGNYEQLKIAKEAVDMILYGAKLTTVYGFLIKAGLHGK